jgi:diadenylate cyclase
VAVKDQVDTAELLRSVLAQVAPGTALRDGLERILRGSTGALIVLGQDKVINALSSGGFDIDIEFSATRLRELAKMDGAVICDRDATRIISAAVQLLPDPSIPTSEQGTRHRTADRVSRQSNMPVISVSKSMNIIALYLDGRRYVLEDSASILSRANQALATLERYRHRLDEVAGGLSTLEIEDLVTARDVSTVIQRHEMVRRISDEIAAYVIELGADGRLLSLQLEELVSDTADDLRFVVRDYLPASGRSKTNKLDAVLAGLSALDAAALLDISNIAEIMGLPSDTESLDNTIHPRGFRLLARVPRLPETIFESLISHFGSLQHLLSASAEELRDVEGVGETRARAIRENLSRVAEASLLERYV